MNLNLNEYYSSLNMRSAWEENRQFAHWLVDYKNPFISVELGVDYGYSLFAISERSHGHVFGIDLFAGDDHAGARDAEFQYKTVLDFINQNGLHRTHVIRGDFATVSANWKMPVDLLHIDGLHTYEAVRSDWDSWAKYVKEDGVVILHDTVSYPGPRQLLEELSNVPSIYVGNFENAAGLGVVTFNRPLFDAIAAQFNNFLVLTNAEQVVPLTGVEPAEPSPSN